MIKLSIIIPIYNIATYLPYCLESIIQQKRAEIEVILVNDGSTDNSGQIAEDYAKLYDYIQVIHQPNQGVSVARNNGLLQAQGEYIWFVDGDDWLEFSESTDKLIYFLEKTTVELVFLPVTKSSDLETSIKKYNLSFDNGRDLLSSLSLLMTHNFANYYPFDKIVSRKHLLTNKIIFPAGKVVSEDFYWNYLLFKSVRNFEIYHGVEYIYRVNRIGSATQKLSRNKVLSILDVLAEVVNDIQKQKFSIEMQQNLLLYTSRVWFFVLPEMLALDKETYTIKSKELLDIYHYYKKNDIDLKSQNKGSDILEHFIRGFGYKHGFIFYSHLVSWKRTAFGEKLIKLVKG